MYLGIIWARGGAQVVSSYLQHTDITFVSRTLGFKIFKIKSNVINKYSRNLILGRT